MSDILLGFMVGICLTILTHVKRIEDHLIPTQEVIQEQCITDRGCEMGIKEIKND